MRKTLLIGAGLALLGVGGWWAKRPPHAPAAVVLPTPPAGGPDSLLLTTAGLVGAGTPQPLLAHTAGRVRRLYFTGGEYVHRGDVLAKLHNYNFVLAPHNGFLGPCRIALGQYLTAATPVSTLSSRPLPVVTLPPGLRGRIRPGDSVQVWVAARPTRVVSGMVAPTPTGEPGAGALEIRLGPGAPFRLGERVWVRQGSRPRPSALSHTPPAPGH